MAFRYSDIAEKVSFIYVNFEKHKDFGMAITMLEIAAKPYEQELYLLDNEKRRVLSRIYSEIADVELMRSDDTSYIRGLYLNALENCVAPDPNSSIKMFENYKDYFIIVDKLRDLCFRDFIEKKSGKNLSILLDYIKKVICLM